MSATSETLEDELFSFTKLKIIEEMVDFTFKDDFSRLEEYFNKLAIKNSKFINPDLEVHTINFIYQGLVYPREYPDVVAVELHENFYENADRLIRQLKSIATAQKNVEYITRKVLVESRNNVDVFTLMPKRLHKFLSKIINCNDPSQKSSFSETETTEFRSTIEPYVEKIKKYLVNKALFFNK